MHLKNWPKIVLEGPQFYFFPHPMKVRFFFHLSNWDLKSETLVLCGHCVLEDPCIVTVHFYVGNKVLRVLQV